jgi:hypothetical protein
MALSDLQTAINGIEAALATEAANPKVSYTLDGKSVDYNSWFKAMTDALESMKRQVNAYQPYTIRTRYFL